MDAISAPVSTLKAGRFPSAANPKDHPTHLIRPAPHSSSLHIPPLPTLSAAAAKPQPHHRHHAQSLRLSSSPQRPRPLDPPRLTVVHRAAATGYAAALLDAARCEGALGAAERDARRLVRGVRAVLADPALGEETKGEVVRGVAEGGGFYRHLVALVRMLVGKGKVGLVGEVMEEVGRICDELRGTRVVVVSTAEKMEEQQLRGIAQVVRKASGAPMVRVKHTRMAAA